MSWICFKLNKLLFLVYRNDWFGYWRDSFKLDSFFNQFPPVGPTTIKKDKKIIGPVIEEVAGESFNDSIRIEKKMTEEQSKEK